MAPCGQQSASIRQPCWHTIASPPPVVSVVVPAVVSVADPDPVSAIVVDWVVLVPAVVDADVPAVVVDVEVDALVEPESVESLVSPPSAGLPSSPHAVISDVVQTTESPKRFSRCMPRCRASAGPNTVRPENRVLGLRRTGTGAHRA